MTRAEVIRFPPQRSAIWITRGTDGAWLTIAGAHGWAHGSRAAALADAKWLCRNLGVPVRERAA